MHFLLPMDDTQLRSELSAFIGSFGWAVSCCRGDRTEAEDLLQSVYLKVLEGPPPFPRALHHSRPGFSQ